MKSASNRRLSSIKSSRDMYLYCNDENTSVLTLFSFGGEVYAYIPGYSGCFECMDKIAAQMGLNINLTIQPTAEEQETIYGMSLPDFQASGLSLDINSIALIQARMALDVLIDGKPGYSGGNWVIHYNRTIPGNETSGRLKTARPMLIRSQKDCACHA